MNRDQYVERCRERWFGQPLRDALMKYGEDRFYNPNGSLNGFLWHYQTVLEPDRSRLFPFLDFEENYQTVFLRRGLIFYCEQILRDIEAETTPDDAEQAKLKL